MQSHQYFDLKFTVQVLTLAFLCKNLDYKPPSINHFVLTSPTHCEGHLCLNICLSFLDGSFLFVPPCRYVFKGAEAIEIQRGPNDSMDNSSDESDSGSVSSDLPDNISDRAENCGDTENTDKIDDDESNVPQAECSNTKTGHVDNVMVEKNDTTRHKQDSLESSTADTNEDCQRTKQETDSVGQNSVSTSKTN